MATFELEKQIWDNCDFPLMGWHDVTLWSVFANTEEFEFLLDLDYIFNWVKPAGEETCFKFWVAPATMVFENAHSIRIDIESAQGGIEIVDLHREEPTLTWNGKHTEYKYRFECHEGEISIKATGFQLYVRSEPILLEGQRFGLTSRNGVSFGREFKPQSTKGY